MLEYVTENLSAQEKNISKMSAGRATKLLQLGPSKNNSSFYDLKEHNPLGRIDLCNYFLILYTMDLIWSRVSLFMLWGLGFFTRTVKFSEQPLLEYIKSRTYSWTPSKWRKYWCLLCECMHAVKFQQFPVNNSKRVNNMFCRYIVCITSGRQHFQHLL
jgi:hypothetical protein